MTWTDRIHQREPYWGAPDLPDGHSRIAEAMGGLADDDYPSLTPTDIAAFAGELDDPDRVHEAMGGLCRADDL